MGTNGPVRWPARSPDLIPLDFFLWGYIKDKVYSSVPDNLNDLKDKISEACASVSPQMLRNVMSGIATRVRLCLARNGRHII